MSKMIFTLCAIFAMKVNAAIIQLDINYIPGSGSIFDINFGAYSTSDFLKVSLEVNFANFPAEDNEPFYVGYQSNELVEILIRQDRPLTSDKLIFDITDILVGENGLARVGTIKTAYTYPTLGSTPEVESIVVYGEVASVPLPAASLLFLSSLVGLLYRSIVNKLRHTANYVGSDSLTLARCAGRYEFGVR